ncbi:MAG: NAD(P)/FAD-dependent oxidoreductase [Candidatus Binatus sp.]|jgi:flavin-dependent dehydrogenase
MFISSPLRQIVFADILVTMASPLDCDVLVVGGGPAGLAVAIAARMNGLSAIVIERHPSPPDKACGECLMPPAVSALNRLGVLDLIDPARRASIDGIRFEQEGAASAESRLPSPGGLGVRRTELTAAMIHRARRLGAEIHERTSVLGYRVQQDQVLAETDVGPVRARFLAAADGLHSRMRSTAGLQATPSRPRRFGIRQHFRVKPWCRFVEVHFTDGVEAYVTPVGPGRVGVAFLWDDASVAQHGASIDKLFERFPSISVRLAGAEVDSRPRGAGPMARTARSRIADRFALVEDAAGYIDAITGEGLSLALVSALTLCRILPAALELGGSRETLLAYQRESAHQFRRYAFVTKIMLAFARRPALHGPVIAMLAGHPQMFSAILHFAVGSRSARELPENTPSLSPAESQD